MRDIRWDKIMLAEFRSLVFLTEDEDRVLTGWAQDKSITWMPMEYNLSDRTISTILSRLRSLYDQVQPFTPLLPPRNVPGKPESPSRNGRGYFLCSRIAKTMRKHCIFSTLFSTTIYVQKGGADMYNNQFNPYGYPQFGQNMAFPQTTYPQTAFSQNQQMQTQGTEVVPVPTIQQVEQVGLQPGQRKMVMVQNEPVIAARYADNMGLVTTEYYRLEKFVPGAATAPQTGDYVTRQEFNAFVESLKSGNKEDVK